MKNTVTLYLSELLDRSRISCFPPQFSTFLSTYYDPSFFGGWIMPKCKTITENCQNIRKE